MKSQRNQNYKNNQINQDVMLSIALIVKNESAVLRRCLDSLQPIREAIPTQLIITDTGSTDDTMEIAREYTEEVDTFTWCDDFAAARNAGLAKATGRWFLYVDADEWFGDTIDLISFFASGEYRSYDTAGYKLRNCIRQQADSGYLDGGIVLRMVDRSKHIVFTGRIHETIPMGKNIRLFEQTYAYHSGYATDHTEEFLSQKSKRNIALLEEELLEDPTDPRLYWHMALEYPIFIKTKEHFTHIQRGYEVIKNQKNSIYYPPIVCDRVICLYLLDQKEKAQDAIVDYFAVAGGRSKAVELDLASYMGLICIEKKNYKQALPWFQKVHQLYEQVKKDGITGFDLVYESIMDTPSHNQKFFLLKALCYWKLGQTEEAFQLVEQMKTEELELEDFKECIPAMIEISVGAKEEPYLAKLYQKIQQEIQQKLQQEEDTERITGFEEALEAQQKGGSEKGTALVSAFCTYFAEVKEPNDYLQLLRVRKLLREGEENNQAGLAALHHLLERGSSLKPREAEVLLAALWQGMSIHQAIQEIDIDQFQYYTVFPEPYFSILEERIRKEVMGYLAENRTQEENLGDLKDIFFLLCLTEHMLLRYPMEEKAGAELFEAYSALGEWYIQQVYAKEVLTDAYVSVLSRNYQFFYYAGKALRIRGRDFKQYGIWMKQALKQVPFFAKLVQASVKLFEEKMASESQKSNQKEQEFAAYATMVKEKIAGLIQQGMKEEALQLIQAYQKINPQDRDGLALLHSLLEQKSDLSYEN